MEAQLLEPPACIAPFSTVAGGHHYIWGGISPRENAGSIGVYDPCTELWTLKPTVGPTPSGLFFGACTAIGDKLYTFGGYTRGSHFNDLCTLDLGCEPFQWNKIEPANDSVEWPLCKSSCGLELVDEGLLLGCFGGFGEVPTCPVEHPETTFIMDARNRKAGRTNEFHLFNLQEGIWSSSNIKGHRPPPCSNFSFTKVDMHRAVLFGGNHPEHGSRVNDVYLFDFKTMECTKVQSVQGEPRPVGRSRHAACCLNYGQEHPTLLLYGGQGNDGETLNDMWLLDIDSGKWTQVIPSESLKPRYWHSLTASSLSPGLTEILMFGGAGPIAETTILRFELSGTSTGKWALVDIAQNKTRGSDQRLKEKTAKIKVASQVSKNSSQDRVRELEEQLQTSQKDAERRIQELNAENGQLQEDLQEMERRAQLAEQRVESLKTHWVVQHKEIEMTKRKLGGGGWGIVKVAKFRGIEVAAKTLYEKILSDYNRHLFIREMNMAARLRHPNLVQFIGATLNGEMIILTELMHTSLRSMLGGGRISREHILSISAQVCQALNYLHLMQPDPVIHRDISSGNVLLNPLPDNKWLAKVTDYGSVNTLRELQTENPGNPAYAAPEARTPSLQSTKMDIFSVGVLLIEMCTGKFPSQDEREDFLHSIQDRKLSGIIRHCINSEKDSRPTALELLNQLV